MRHDLGGAVRALALPTLALLGVAALAPGRFELAVRIYALVFAFVVVVLALLALRRALPPESALSPATPPGRPPEPPPSLVQLHNEVVLGIGSSADLHFRLVPRLRAISAGLLSARRSLSLEGEPEAARAALGEDAWRLLRPDRPAPQDRLTTGIPAPELERAVEALEAV